MLLSSHTETSYGAKVNKKERKKTLEQVTTKIEKVHGQNVVVKVYPEEGKRKKQHVRCKG